MPALARSALAVVVGFVLIGALSIGTDVLLIAALPGAFDANRQTDDPRLLALILAYVGVYATVGCYVTARLAPGRPMRHALVLGLLGLAMNVAVSIATWGAHPTWFVLAGLATTMVWAWLGGRLREREVARERHAASPALAR